MTDGLKRRQRDAIIAELSANPKVERVVLFGSRAMGTFTPTSDVDIALFGNDLTLSDQAALSEAMGELSIPQRVDILIHHRIDSPALREHIRRRGVEWLARKQPALRRSVMTEEWQKGKLGDCILLHSGGTPSKSRADCWGGDTPWISAKDMKSFWIDDSQDHLTEAGVAHATRLVDAGTTLMLVRGMTLHNDVPVCRVRRSATFNQDVKAVIARTGTHADFVPYLLLGNKQRLLSIVDSAGHGTGRLNTDTLLRLPVGIPPLKEQEAIACILGAMDDKIELNRRMNRTLEAMARAIFKSWFVDFDPVRAKAAGQKPPGLKPEIAALFPDGFEDSELGEIPKGWTVKPLYDTAQWVNGAAFKSVDFCAHGQGLPVIKIAELKDGIGPRTNWCRRDAASNQIIDTGDLLYSWSGSPDTSLEAFLWSGGRGLLNQHIFKVITSAPAQKRFIYYLLQHLRPLLVETARNKQTTGLGHVTVADMKRLLICMPSKKVLAAFDRAAGALFDRAFVSTLESCTVAALRDALLPKLTSGELRLRDAQRIVERAV